MKTDVDTMPYNQIPQFINQSQTLLKQLKGFDYEGMKSIWKCNDSIAGLNFERIQNMDLNRNLTPALLAYEGIQY